MKKEILKPAKKRESVRGKLEYYKELLHQHDNEKGKESEVEIQDKSARQG